MKYPEFSKLVEIIEKLRDPKDGCPWDLKQSHTSLLKYLIEESYEYLDAAERDHKKDMEEELGDILLQILLHATIGKEENNFTIESISKTLSEKLVYRHPHVFNKKDSTITPEQVKKNWQTLKEQKKSETPQAIKEDKFKIDRNYLKQPSLIAADKIGKKTNRVGFDWKDAQDVLLKVEEELHEFKDALTRKNTQDMKEELGDLMFTIAQVARHLKFDPEETLRMANKKFIDRYDLLNDYITRDNKSIDSISQVEMNDYWNQVKNNEKKRT